MLDALEISEQYAKYDESRTPNPFRIRLEAFAKAAGWVYDEDHAPVLGFDRRKPKGHRCIWSAKWDTSNGQIGPDYLMPLENMTMAELAAEAVDVLHRSDYCPIGLMHRLQDLVLSYSLDDYGEYVPGHIPQKLRDTLRGLRAGYPGYLAPWDLPKPELILRVIWRPGWGPAETKGEVKNVRDFS